MNYLERVRFHYKPQKGWINDPNGLVWFDGWYHLFYQHNPFSETPFEGPMYWGHARTKDFLAFEELPLALAPEKPYDKGGCWSGTAIVRDDTLFLFYASIRPGEDPHITGTESVSVAYSKDGVHFEKYEGNPVIAAHPDEGCPDFRDPAVTQIDGRYYLVMASGKADKTAARLLLYESGDLLVWTYRGVLYEWPNAMVAECPSITVNGNELFIGASVVRRDEHELLSHEFFLMCGSMRDGVFMPRVVGSVDRGPDQYAGQFFAAPDGRKIMISWIPGWDYRGFAEKDIGCLSLPREIVCRDGKLYGYPVKEVRHLLTDGDEALERTETGFIIRREGREPVVYTGEVKSLACLRDAYILEVFVNGGEDVFTAIL